MTTHQKHESDLTPPKSAGPTAEDKARDLEQAWRFAIYQSAIADVRWAKEQGWRVVQWTFALFSGVLALAKFPFGKLEWWWMFLFVAFILAWSSIWYVCNLHDFATESRAKLDATKDGVSERVNRIFDLKPRDANDPNGTKFRNAQIILIVVYSIGTGAGLWWIYNGGQR